MELISIYNIGSGRSIKIQDLLNLFLEIFDFKNVEVEQRSDLIKKFDTPKIVADVSKLKKLSWNPIISIEDSINKIKNSILEEAVI